MSTRKLSLSGGVLLVALGVCLAERAVAFDSQHIKIDVVVDDETLRFPEPIFGFVVVTNQSEQAAFLPITEGGKLSFAVGDVQTHQLFPTLGQTELRKVPAGFSYKIPFVYCVSNREQIRGILRNKASVDITFSIDTIPKRKVISQQRRPDVIEFAEAGGFDWLESAPVKVHFSKKPTIFSGYGGAHFYLEVLKVNRWPKSDEPIELSFVPFKPKPGVSTPDFGLVEDVGKDSLNYLPIAHVFPHYLRDLQAVVSCDTATWRILELQRIQRTLLIQPRTDKSLLRAVDDEIDVLKCAGRAESYFLDGILTKWETMKVMVNGNSVFLPDYAYELKNCQALAKRRSRIESLVAGKAPILVHAGRKTI